MQTITLKAAARVIGAKRDLKAIRRAGNVPCIIYGNGSEHKDISIALADVQKITDTPKSFIVHVDLEGKIIPCILHDAQFDPITDKPIHVDFLAIAEGKPVEIAIPVKVTGNAEGVKQGGRLRVGVRKVKVNGPLDKLPDEIEIDVTPLGVGKAIYAGDLNVEGCKIASPKKLMVCEVKMTRNVVSQDAATEGAAPAEGAAAAPAAEAAK